ncbi:hypothetical protein ACWEQC_41930 [Streptomyces shenzhenensis]
MYSTDRTSAWDHPPTRRAWMMHMTMNVVGLVGWPAGWVILLGVSMHAPNWAVWLFMPFFLYGFYRFCNQLTYFRWGGRMRRVLREYPWQSLERVPSGLGKHPAAQDDDMWFEFRNPDVPDERIPLVFLRHQRSYWWLRRMDGPRAKPRRRAQIEPLWFAGDPRFLAVVAAPTRNGKTPKRLHLLYQRSVFDSGRTPQGWDADISDSERARRAGATYVAGVAHPHV